MSRLRKELGRLLAIIWHHHMKDHVEMGHLTNFNALMLNRDQGMGHDMV